MNKESLNNPSRIVSELESEFVELYKILKFEGIADSGGAAKQAISDGLVSVNGQVETRKSKKIGPGDQIEVRGQTIDVIAKGDDQD